MRLFVFVWDKISYGWSSLRLMVDRILAERGYKQLLMPAFVCVISFILVAASLGFFVYKAIGIQYWFPKIDYVNNPYVPNNIFDAAYYLLFTNGGQNVYEHSHLVGFVITTLGIILLAFLTSSMTSMLERIAQRYIDGESTYRLKNHIVILGASDFLYSIINEKAKSSTRTKFLIMTGLDVAKLRREVFSFLGDGLRSKDFVFLYGERTSSQDVSRLSLQDAKEVFVIGDTQETDQVESYRDAYNMDSVAAMGQYLEKAGKTSPLVCHVLFEYQTTFAAFQFSEISKDLKKHIDFRPFNFYDLWARKVIVAGQAGEYRYHFLDTAGFTPEDEPFFLDKDSDQTVHLIILGMTKMGIAMALQAAHICHFPNFKTGNGKRTRITFVDSDADIEFNYFKGRFPSLMEQSRVRMVDYTGTRKKEGEWRGDEDGWLDIEWEFIKGRIEQDEVQDYLKESAACKQHIVTIAVCLPKSHQSIAAAMYMPTSVYEDCLQILTCQRLSGHIVDNMAHTQVGNRMEMPRYAKLIPFGMVDQGYDSSLDDDTAARMIAYVYDSYYAVRNNEPSGKCDHTFEFYDQPYSDGFTSYEAYAHKWRETYVMDKMSSAFNANTLLTKLRGVGLSPDQCPMELDEEKLSILMLVEHNRWNMEKLLTGYRTLTKDEVKHLKELRSSDMAAWRAERKRLKGWPIRAHLDICSYEDLKEREEQFIIDFDKALNAAIPYILKRTRENA